MKQNRYLAIDMIRGIAMLVVFLLHALALYLNQRTIFYIWDYFHFAVASFVFCSAYLFFKKGITSDKDISTPPSYFLKRVQRLYMPYFYFLLVLFSLMVLFEPARLSAQYIMKSLLVIGGVDISWMVLLFVQFTLLFPLLLNWYRHQKVLYYLYSFIAIGFSVFLFFYSPDIHWKWLMWLPWSVMALLAILFVESEEKKFQRINIVYGVSFLAFILFQVLEFVQDGRITIYTHKYPPDITILVFGIVMIGIMHKATALGVFEKLRLVPFLSFLSAHSYPLFFVHYVIIYLMNRLNMHKELPAFGYFAVLLVLTVVVQKLIVVATSRIKHTQK